MPPPNETARLLPSVLDRLIDTESMGGKVAGYDHRQMMTAVRADLEDLLNTRQTHDPDAEALPEVGRSIVTYGLPDLANYPAGSAQQSAELCRVVAKIIARNEPRLKNVRVSLAKEAGKAGHAVRFHIEAMLNLNPAPEVGFETVVELITGRATVRQADGAG